MEPEHTARSEAWTGDDGWILWLKGNTFATHAKLEPDVLEFDTAGAIAGARMCRRDDVRGCVDQLEDALGRRHRGLQNVVFVAEVLYGAEEALRVLDEGNENAESDNVSEDAQVRDASVRGEIVVVRDPSER